LKQTGRFGFGFISLKPKKPNQTQTEKNRKKNQAKTEPNRFKPVFVLKTQTETNRFESVSVFL
jgi:hypothetical protein